VTRKQVDEVELRRRWDRSAKLRDEFLGEFSIYLALRRADARGAYALPDVDKWLAILEKHYSEERVVLEFAQRVLNKERARASRERKGKAKALLAFKKYLAAHHRYPSCKVLASELEADGASIPDGTIRNYLTEFKKAHPLK
jgi:hypothetical protein